MSLRRFRIVQVLSSKFQAAPTPQTFTVDIPSTLTKSLPLVSSTVVDPANPRSRGTVVSIMVPHLHLGLRSSAPISRNTELNWVVYVNIHLPLF